jgi:hypothetical protein
MKECYKPKTSDEIQKASEEYILKTHIDNASVQDHFIAGAELMQERMIEKATEWFEKYLFDIGYPDNWCRDSPNLISGKDRFIKAMQDESK